jgi:AraC-like DNA-binding protein
VQLRHDGGRPFVADPGLVTFYNRGQRYQRAPLGGPDESDWYAVRSDIVVDAVRQFDRRVDDHPERPFEYEHGPSDSRLYLRQRALFISIGKEPHVADPLETEEAVIGLLYEVLDRTYASRGRAEATRAHREIAEHAKVLLAERFCDPVGLEFFARHSGATVFQLCRAFRAVTGSTLHSYRNRLRLQASLPRIADGEPLTEIALDLGFSSHSHFTAAFRQLFGSAPSVIRRELS